jgi:ribosomal protein S18 acetylase RimI-like enzyme
MCLDGDKCKNFLVLTAFTTQLKRNDRRSESMDQNIPAWDAAAVSATSTIATGERDIVVRRPTNSDISSLAAHFSEMQAHYNQPVPPNVAERAATLACKPVTNTFDPRVLIAVAGSVVVGSVVMNVTFPASELSMSLYIRDLYVAKAARRSGVGRMLVKAATHLAVSEGFSAVEWTADSTNKAALRLYESCGARQMDRTYFRERRGILKPVTIERRGSSPAKG